MTDHLKSPHSKTEKFNTPVILTDEALAEIEARANAATELPGDGSTVRVIYDHGGGRMYVQRNAERDLILDSYNRGDSEFYFHAREDIPALCQSLRALKRQARELALIVDVGTSDDPGTAITKLRKLERDAATRMRQACVEKVRAIRDKWHDQYVAADSSTREALVRKEMLFAQCRAARDIIKEIESLTLEAAANSVPEDSEEE